MRELPLLITEAVLLGALMWIIVWAPGALYLAVRRRGRGVLVWLRRTAPVAIFYPLYYLIRVDSAQMGSQGKPLDHARTLVGFERAIHIWWEPALSRLRVPGAHFYYDWSHFLLTLLVLSWVGTTQPQIWKRARNAFLLINTSALIVFYAWPTDPPRLLPVSYGIHGHSLGMVGAAAAQFASFPSLHIGYAVWVAMVLGAAGRRWGRIGWLHVTLTAIVVVVTGNHYIVDVLAGLVVGLSCWTVSARLTDRRSTGTGKEAESDARPAGGPVMDPVDVPLPVAARLAISPAG